MKKIMWNMTLPLLLVLVIGCKKAKEEKEDLGPEVAGEQIDQALNKAISGSNLSHIRPGQMVEYLETQRIETEETVINLGGTFIEVIRPDPEDEKKLALLITKRVRLEDGSFETKITEEPFEIADAPSLLATGFKVTALRSQMAQTKAKPERITYHKLREFERTIDAPPRTRLRSDCGGLNPCQISVRYIQFDMVIWSSETEYQKISFDFGFSVQTPYLPFGTDFDQLSGALVMDCRSGYIPVGARTFYVRQCKDLVDLQK
ncbi:MAG: hypothetical protein AB7G93_07675 [Bdellovibrionales bacterium]